jgi:hypothetical protein
MPQGESTQVRGVVQSFHQTPRGDVDGLVLEDGRVLRFPPHFGAQVNRPADVDLNRFFTQNPDFELASNRVAAYVAANPSATARLDQPAATVLALKARERIFRLTPTFEHSDPLLQAGIDSARAVETLGSAALHAQFDPALGPAAVQLIINNACFVTAAVGMVRSRHSAQFNGIQLRGLPTLSLVANPTFLAPSGGTPAPGQPPPPVYLPPPMADWETLFGTVDLCACDECSSVYGPAAYLVDVLDFLSGVPSTLTYTSGTETLLYYARDLLIGAAATTTGFSPVGRRPDIGHILLDCDNADTPVPYIDLLNEILEYKVNAVTGPPFNFVDGAATTGQAADLSTNRQILAGELPVYTSAYALLAAASYPWSLPFDRAAQEAIAHLALLGVPAPTLMQTFTPALVPADEAAAELAAVTLGLLPRDRAIVVGRPFLVGPASPEKDWDLTDSTAWQTQLLVVGTFLNATGMAYADLLELLDASLFTPFLAGPARPSIGLITPLPGGSDCDPMNLTINGLDASKLTVLWPLVHRFLRLRGKLGVTATELDKAIAQFGNVVTRLDVPSSTLTCSSALSVGASLTLSSTAALPAPLVVGTTYYVVNPTASTFQVSATSGGAPITLADAGGGTLTFTLASGTAVPTLDDTTLERLSVVMTIRAQLGTPILEMISWWGPLDRRSSPLSRQASLFSQTFLNPALSNAVDDEALFDELADSTLSPGAAPPGSPAPTLADHAARVAAASQLSGSDFALLTDGTTSLAVLGLASEIGGSPSPTPPTPLTLDNVSHAFRVASLARALKLSVSDLLQLRALAGVDPFDGADLAQVTSFIKTARQVQSSGFTVPELAYLLRQLAPSTTASSLVPAQAAAFLADIAPLLDKIVTDTTFVSLGGPSDPRLDDPTGAVTTKVLGTILLPADVATALATVQAPTTANVPTSFSFLTPALLSQLTTELLGSAQLELRYGYTAAALLLHQRRTQSIALVEGKLAAALKLDRSITSGLLETWILSGSGGSTTLTAIEDFLRPATPDGTGPSLTDAATASYVRIQKVATLVSRLRIRATELPVLFPAPFGLGLLDPNALPATPGTVAPVSTALFASWQRLADAFAVRARLRGGPTALFDLIGQATAATATALEDFFTNLSQATGWAKADVSAVAGLYGLTLADFQKETGTSRWRTRLTC